MERTKTRRRRQVLGTAVAATAAIAAASSLIPRSESEDARQDRSFSRNITDTAERTARKPINLKETLYGESEVLQLRGAAIQSLTASLPKDPKVDHLRDTAHLEREATAYVPSVAERQNVFDKSEMQLKELAAAIPVNDNGLFGFADIDEKGIEQHRLYVLRKGEDGTLRFALGFRVAMAEKGFGNRKDSGQTPVGLTWIEDGYKGMYGEVVTVLKDALPYFKRIVIGADGKQHRFVSNFGEPRIEPASVITARYTINRARGIHFHGSNRTGKWVDQGHKRVWHSSLGRKGSGACGRMANADVEILGRLIRLPVMNGDKIVHKGTPVYIHATTPVMARSQNVEADPDDPTPPRDTRSSRKEPSRSGGTFNPFKEQNN